MATQRINIIINATGGVTVIRTLQGIAGAANSAVGPLRALEHSLRAVSLALGIRQLMDWADEWITASNKIAVFAKNQEETNTILGRLYDVAQTVRQPLKEIVSLYHRLAIGSKELGTSINDNIAFTENIGKALAIQGTSTNQARGALVQLSQAMGMGRIRAQEWNSMIENLPLVLVTVAKHMDGMGGSVSKLRQKMLDHKLTSKEFFDAFMKGGGDLEKMYQKVNKTFAQAFTVMGNAMIRFLGQTNETLGISNKFFAVVEFLSKNLDTIAKTILVIMAIAAAAFAPAIILAFSAALSFVAVALGYVIVGLGTVTMLLLANPFVLIVAAVAAVIAFGDAWNSGIDSMTSVKDVLRAIAEVALQVADVIQWALTGAILERVGELSKMIAPFMSIFNALGSVISGSTESWTQSFQAFYADTGTGLAGMVRSVAKTMDAIGGFILGLAIGIGRFYGELPGLMGNAFGQAYNAVVPWLERIVNATVSGINTIRGVLGKDLIATVNFARMDVDKQYFQKYGAGIGEAMKDGFDMQGGFLLGKVNKLFSRAQEIGKARRAGSTDLSGMDVRGEAAALQEKAKKGHKSPVDKLQNELRTLLNRIDPAAGAILEVAKAQDILNRAVDSGLISEKDRQRYLISLEAHYKDIIDPLGKYTREMQEQARLSGMGAQERSREEKFLEIKKDLLLKSKIITADEETALKKQIELNQNLNELMQIRDSLMSASVDRRKQEHATISQVGLLKAGKSGFTATDATAAMSEKYSELFAKTDEMKALELAKANELYVVIQQMRDTDLISEKTAQEMRARAYINTNEEILKASKSFAADLEGFTSSTLSDAMNGNFKNIGDNFKKMIDKMVVEWLSAKFMKAAAGNMAETGVAGGFLGDMLKKVGGFEKITGESAGKAALQASQSSLATSTVSLTTAQAPLITAMTTLTAAASTAASVLGSMGAMQAGSTLAGLTAGNVGAGLGIANAVGAAGGDSLGSFINVMGFDKGGYTGSGGKFDPAGIVHKGEYVITADRTRQLGVDFLERLQTGKSLQGYSEGGFVGGTGAPLLAGRGSQDVTVLYKPDTTNNKSSGSTPVQVTNHFVIQGNADRATQEQIAARVGASIQRATARNT